MSFSKSLGIVFPLSSGFLASNSDDLHLILFDSSGLCKTAILLQSGITYAETYGEAVYFLMPQPLTALPPSIHGMPYNVSSAMPLLKFIYLKSYEDVISYLSRIHQMASPLPAALIVDEVDFYLAEAKKLDDCEQRLAKFFGLLVDTAAFISSKRKSSCSLWLGLKDNSYYQNHMPLLRLFFSECWLITSCDDSSNNFSLSVKQNNKHNWKQDVKLHILNSIIYLHSITEEETQI